MVDTLVGLFKDSKQAGEAVSDFVEKGFTNDVTVISKDEKSGDVHTHEVKKDVSDGTATGAISGAAVGTVAALLSGVSSFLVPGVGLFILGPLATLVAGLGAGALTGGIVGALVDWGLPEETAKQYQERLKAGEVLVGVNTEKISLEEATAIMERHNASETHVLHR